MGSFIDQPLVGLVFQKILPQPGNVFDGSPSKLNKSSLKFVEDDPGKFGVLVVSVDNVVMVALRAANSS